MNKTVKVNLGGFAFLLDEDAFEQLRSYLLQLEKQFENTEGGKEIVEDIESRIAELLQNKIVEGKEVVNLRDVKEVIGVMGEPEAYTDEDGEQIKSSYKAKGKWYREPQNAIIGGVASGLATYFGVSAVWIRFIFLLSVFAWTTGFWVYLILWLVLPKRKLTIVRSDEKNLTPFENLLNNIFILIGKLFRFVWRVITIVLGLSLILAGFPVLVAVIGCSIFPSFSWFYLHGVSLLDVFSFLKFAFLPEGSVFAVVLMLLVILIPLVLVTYWGVRLLLWIKVRDAWLHVSAALMWFAACILFALFVTSNVSRFSEHDTDTLRVEMSSAPDTLWIDVKTPIDRELFTESLQVPDDNMTFYYNDEKRLACGSIGLNVRNSKDSLACFYIEKDVFGKDRNGVLENMVDVTYDYNYDARHLCLDEGYNMTSDEISLIPSSVEIDLFVPENTVLIVDRRIKSLIDHEWVFENIKNEVVFVDK